MLVKLKNSLKKMLRDQRGAMLVITTAYLPVIVGFFSLAVDMSYVYRTYNMLQTTADAAALAAMEAQTLPTINATTACTVAKDYATKNMSVASFGNVLKQNTSSCTDVVVGTWSCAAGTLCTAAKFTAGGSAPNAIQVTTRTSSVNGNSLALAFASMVGWSNMNVSATAISAYGNDPGAVPLTVSLVQDVSGSFEQEIDSAKTADQALANCLLNATGAKLGISIFAKSSQSYLSPTAVNSGTSTTITTSINNINVGGKNMPDSGGTDIAAGLNTAIGQICPGSTCTPPPTAFKPAIVLITDGLPNMCAGKSCNTSSAKANAEAAAKDAADKGMDVYAIYFCNDGTGTCNSSTNIDASNWLATKIVKGNGKFKASATASDMAKLMGDAVCKPAVKVRLVF